MFLLHPALQVLCIEDWQMKIKLKQVCFLQFLDTLINGEEHFNRYNAPLEADIIFILKLVYMQKQKFLGFFSHLVLLYFKMYES